MNPHEWYEASRISYVTRTLDAAEEKSFAEHLTRCPECQASIEQLEAEFAWLPMGVTPAPIRPGFRGEIARALLVGSTSTPRRWIAPLALAASMLIAIGATVGGTLPARREATRLSTLLAARDTQLIVLQDTLSVMRESSRVLQDTLSVMRESSRVLQTPITFEGMKGGLVIFADDARHRWQVVMHGLPAAPAGRAYQFWFICADGMIRDATLIGDPNRPAVYTLLMPPHSGAVLGASLTLEPMHDESKGPKGKELAHILL